MATDTLTSIAELPALAQATRGQVAQSSPSVPQMESLPDLPRIPTFEQDAQTERFLQSPVISQQAQKQLPSTEVLPAIRPMPKIDFGMKLLAGIAAARGNFGPAFEIKQMERKGPAYTEYLEGRRQFNHLMSRGEDKKAEEVLRESSVRALSIAPELKELVNADTERLYKRQETKAQVQGLIAFAKLRQKRDGVDNQGFIDILEASDPFAHTPEGLKVFLESAGYDFAPNPSQNQMIRKNKYDASVTAIQLPYSFSEQNLKGPVGDFLVSATGYPAHEISNAINDQAVMRGGVNVGPALKQAMLPLITMGRGIESQLELVKAAPYTPEQTQALRQTYKAQGMDDAEANFMVATRGAVPASFLKMVRGVGQSLTAGGGVSDDERARELVVAERRRIAEDAIKVKGNVPMALVPELQHLVVVHKGGVRQWTAERGSITYNQASADTDKYGVMDGKLFETKVQPMTIAMQDLKAVKEMFAYAGHPQDIAGRFSSGAQQLITRYMGSSDARDAKLQVARVLATRAIEQVNGTANIPDAEIGRLRSILTGVLADEKGGVAGTQMLIDNLTDKINVYIGDNSQSVTRDISKPTPSTPTPTVATLNKAAGVTGESKSPQASNKAMLNANEAIANTIEGMDDINTPLEQSKNYQANSGQVTGNGSVTGKQAAQVVVSTRLNELLKKKKIKPADAEKYVVGDGDSKEMVVSKLRETALLMGGVPKSTSAPSTKPEPAFVPTPPIGTGPITLNPGVTRIPKGR